MTNEHKQSNLLQQTKTESSPRQYWMRPEEVQGAPVSEHRGEFVTDPRETPDAEGVSRRDFLKLVGISSVLAGAAACSRRPIEKIVPYLNKPEEITLGQPLWYSSTLGDCGVLVKTREGRPIKLEGNPDHPANRGGLGARAQASIWNLYDPDRLQKPQLRKGDALRDSSVADLDAYVTKVCRAARGKVRVLSGRVSGPAERRAMATFAKEFAAQVVQFDMSDSALIAKAQEQSYGQGLLPSYRLADANVVLSLGADFLGTWGQVEAQARDWQRQRQLYGKHDHEMSKLICIEPHLSLTGTNADERYMVAPGDLLRAALTLAHELAANYAGNQVPAVVQRSLAAYKVSEQAEVLGVPAARLSHVAKLLWKNRRRSVVLGGTLSGELGVALQNVVNFINSILDNDGVSVDWQRDVPGVSASANEDLAKLITDMQSGAVDTLVIADANPAFVLPEASGFAAALAKVKHVIVVADRLDETAQHASAVMPLSHPLERWGDAEVQRGVFSICQPTIRPLYESRALAASVLAWAGVVKSDSAETEWHGLLQQHWQREVRGQVDRHGLNAKAFWEHSLRTGVAVTKAPGRTAPRDYRDNALREAMVVQQRYAKATNSERFQLVVTQSFAMGEGEGANNSWLQELPEPVSKITWDNYISVAPSAAKENGWNEGDVLELAVAEGGSARLPVHIQPGMHPRAMLVARGYGRKHSGRVGDGLGVNVQSLAVASAQGPSWAGHVLDVKTTTGHVELAVTQGHHRIEGRPILQEATLEEYKHDHHAGAGAHHIENVSLWEPHAYPGYRWAMGIDLNSCTGCSACVIACSVENNIPPVGKSEVLVGREMHWIRIDRYYSGDENDPQVTHQPMLCQHCEKAPCETVCPVLATTHSSDGLNEQIYNRCVGTRYCANNCPYKVRRFNWFDWGNKKMVDYAWDSPLHLMLNPDVTVREKGVMEKCSFCVQRVRSSKETAKKEGREVRDGELQTACQQSCPTQAIRFGNINDEKSQVSKFAHHARGFHVLAELNVLPQVTYLTKIRNS